MAAVARSGQMMSAVARIDDSECRAQQAVILTEAMTRQSVPEGPPACNDRPGAGRSRQRRSAQSGILECWHVVWKRNVIEASRHRLQ
jgi:hypothetical protein